MGKVWKPKKPKAAKPKDVGDIRSAKVVYRRPDFQAQNEAAMTALKERLERMQIRMPDRPTGPSGKPINPTLPSDLTALNDIQLGQLHGQFASMVQFVQLRLAIQSVRTRIAEREVRWLRAKTRLGATGTVGDKEAQVEVDEEVQEKSFKAEVELGREALERDVMQSYLVGRDVCSREMTRRQMTTYKRDLD